MGAQEQSPGEDARLRARRPRGDAAWSGEASSRTPRASAGFRLPSLVHPHNKQIVLITMIVAGELLADPAQVSVHLHRGNSLGARLGFLSLIVRDFMFDFLPYLTFSVKWNKYFISIFNSWGGNQLQRIF